MKTFPHHADGTTSFAVMSATLSYAAGQRHGDCISFSFSRELIVKFFNLLLKNGVFDATSSLHSNCLHPVTATKRGNGGHRARPILELLAHPFYSTDLKKTCQFKCMRNSTTEIICIRRLFRDSSFARQSLASKCQ